MNATIARRTAENGRIPWDANLKRDLAQNLDVEERQIEFSIWWDDVTVAYISGIAPDSPLWILFTGDRERGIVSLEAHEIEVALVGVR